MAEENLAFNDLDRSKLFYKEINLKELDQQVSRFSENPKEKKVLRNNKLVLPYTTEIFIDSVRMEIFGYLRNNYFG